MTAATGFEASYLETGHPPVVSTDSRKHAVGDGRHQVRGLCGCGRGGEAESHGTQDPLPEGFGGPLNEYEQAAAS